MLNPEDLSYEWKKNILVCRCDKQLKIQLETAKELVENRKSFTNKKNTHHVLILPNLVGMDKDARDFFISVDGTEDLISLVFVTNSILGKVIVNFLINNFNKSNLPIHLCSTEKEAFDWISKLDVN